MGYYDDIVAGLNNAGATGFGTAAPVPLPPGNIAPVPKPLPMAPAPDPFGLHRFAAAPAGPLPLSVVPPDFVPPAPKPLVPPPTAAPGPAAQGIPAGFVPAPEQAPPAGPMGEDRDVNVGIPNLPNRFQMVSGGGSRTTPAHEEILVSPRVYGREVDAMEAQKEQIAEADINAALSASRANELLGQHVERAAAEVDDAKLRERLAQASMEEQQQKMEDFRKEWADGPKAKLSDGEKIGSAMSVLMGAIGSVMSVRGGGDGANAALPLVEKLIERKTRQAEQAYAYGNEALGASYKAALERFGTPEAARLAVQSANTAQARAELAKQADTARSDAERSSYQQAIAGLDKQIADFDMKSHMYVPARTVSSGPTFIGPGGLPYTLAQAQAFNLKQAERGENTALDTSKAIATARGEASAKNAGDVARRTVQTGAGGTVVARSESQAVDMDKRREAAARLDSILEAAQGLRAKISFAEKAGNKVGIESSNIAKLKQLESEALTEYAVSKGLGALSKEDMELAKNAIGNFAEFSASQDNDAKLAQARSSVRKLVGVQDKKDTGFVAMPPKSVQPR